MSNLNEIQKQAINNFFNEHIVKLIPSHPLASYFIRSWLDKIMEAVSKDGVNVKDFQSLRSNIDKISVILEDYSKKSTYKLFDELKTQLTLESTIKYNMEIYIKNVIDKLTDELKTEYNISDEDLGNYLMSGDFISNIMTSEGLLSSIMRSDLLTLDQKAFYKAICVIGSGEDIKDHIKNLHTYPYKVLYEDGKELLFKSAKDEFIYELEECQMPDKTPLDADINQYVTEIIGELATGHTTVTEL